MSKLTKKKEEEEKEEKARPVAFVQRPYLDSASASLASMLPEQVIIKDASKLSNWDFDSNCVTPGSEFMAKAATWLHSFAQSKISSGQWSDEVVIVVSDSSVPGEGEHKIVEWIRSQRDFESKKKNGESESTSDKKESPSSSQPSSSSASSTSSSSSSSQPHWTHLIYGADADLIFLGLALHLAGVYILREGTLPKSQSNKSKGYLRIRQGGANSNKISRDTVFVSEINPNVTEMELGRLFEPCGTIASVRVIAEGHGKPLNFGFVRFGSLGVTGEASEEEMAEVERSIAKALTLNGHKMRGRGIGVERARRPNSKATDAAASQGDEDASAVPLSEAEQLQILDKREVMTAEFMSTTGMEEERWAQSILSAAQWRLDDAFLIYVQYSSSGIPFDMFMESYAIQKSQDEKNEKKEKKERNDKTESKVESKKDSNNQIKEKIPDSQPNAEEKPSNDPSTQSSASNTPVPAAEGEEEEDSMLGSLHSPYVLVHLAELSSCFNQRFSHVSIFENSGEPFEANPAPVNNIIVRQPYVPSQVDSTPSTSSPSESSSAPSDISSPSDAQETLKSEIASPVVTLDPSTSSGTGVVPDEESSEIGGLDPAKIAYKSFEIGRVLDDFVLLGMVFGNDFLPSLPAQDIKTGSFNELLDDYEKVLVWEGHLAERSDFDLTRLARILDLVSIRERKAVVKRIRMTWRYERQQKKKEEKKERAEKDKFERQLARALAAAKQVSSVLTQSEGIANQPSKQEETTKETEKEESENGPRENGENGREPRENGENGEKNSSSLSSLTSPSSDAQPSTPVDTSSTTSETTRRGSRTRRSSSKTQEGDENSNTSSLSPSSPTSASTTGDSSSPSSKAHHHRLNNASRPPRPIVIEEPIPEPSESDILSRRVRYYIDNFPEIDFSSDTTDEAKLSRARRVICENWLRTVSWVMRYYFTGCPSWSTFYTHHYAPFAVDIAIYLRELSEERQGKISTPSSSSTIPIHRSASHHVVFDVSEPFKPLEQLVAVLPPESLSVLPPALRPLLSDPSSPLFPYIPRELVIQKSDGISSSVAKWHGVLRLPFIPRDTLIQAVRAAIPKLDIAAVARNLFGQNVAYVSTRHALSEPLQALLKNDEKSQEDDDKSHGEGEKAQDEEETMLQSLFEPMPIRHLKPSSITGHSSDSFIRFYFESKKQ